MAEHLEPISLKLEQKKKTKKWYAFIPSGLRILLGLVVFVWAFELLDIIPGVNLDLFGVKPREIGGLIGIPLMPFLHADLAHLASNTLPFLFLGWIVLQAERKKFIIATVVIVLLGGLGTWLIGTSGTNHIGASGLVYGYFGYVMTRAIMERKLIWIVTGIVVAVVYGSVMLSGILPMQAQDISIAGHFCGLLAGAWFGWKRTQKVRELEVNPEDDADKIVKQISDAVMKDNDTDKIIKDITEGTTKDGSPPKKITLDKKSDIKPEEEEVKKEIEIPKPESQKTESPKAASAKIKIPKPNLEPEVKKEPETKRETKKGDDKIPF